jgi:hypothetical protein
MIGKSYERDVWGCGIMLSIHLAGYPAFDGDEMMLMKSRAKLENKN